MTNEHSRVAWLAVTASLCFTLIIASWMCAPGVPAPGIGAQDAPPSIASAPVTLTSDSALDSFTPKTGAGTAGDPYVIQNLEISSSSVQILFDLENTQKHVIIRGCTFTNTLSTSNRGIYLNNAENVIVENCTFTNFHSSSTINMMLVSNCDSITIQNNRFEDCTGSVVDTTFGIYILSSFHINVTGNSMTRITGDFIRLLVIQNTRWISVSGNTLMKCTGITTLQGIWVYNSTDSVFSRNVFEDLSGPACIAAYFGNNFFNSRVESNHFYGLQGSSACAIYISSLHSGTFLENKVENLTSSGSHAFYIVSSSQDLVIARNIFSSGEIPIYLQGTGHVLQDTGWYAPTAQYRYVGNYYWNYTGADANGDFIGDTPVNVGGGFVDPYPILYGGLDNDDDGLYNAEELGTYHTNPNAADTDGDGWNDAYELKVSGTNPLSMDSDGDGKIDSVDPTPGFADPTTSEPDLTTAIYAASGIIGGSMVAFGVLIVVAARKGSKGQGRVTPNKA